MTKTSSFPNDRVENGTSPKPRLRFSPPVRDFIKDAAQFIVNYLPMEIDPITDIFSNTLQEIVQANNLPLDHLISKDPLELKRRLAEYNLGGVLKREYAKILIDQDPIIDICVEGLLNSKFGL